MNAQTPDACASGLDVLLASPRGFCAGVDRAIDIVERALQLFGAPIYVRHEIVHNTTVVQSLRADFDWLKPDRTRREFLRARRNAQGGVELFAHQGSGVLTSAMWADGLVDLAPGQTVRRGDVVPFVAFSEWGL
ncbi:4-hydroxy-3-methylbut-2-enyl diphosphate reductase [mine drainage metagenome]|uniref:4-hydroxy-3-methylbut-2-enyl diphosphate reductase n=1 Tax=mine drainage metagenome TaxID=410659 RepID=A0A1J5Q5Y7_9ZZZZ